MPLAYLHGQLKGSLLSDGILMGWEDRLLNTAQLLRFNYRARLPLSPHWHSDGGLGAGGRWVPDSCLGSRSPFPPPHWNACFPSHAEVPLACTTGKKTTRGPFTPLLTSSERLLSCESAQAVWWEPLHSASSGIRPRQTRLQLQCLSVQWYWTPAVSMGAERTCNILGHERSRLCLSPSRGSWLLCPTTSSSVSAESKEVTFADDRWGFSNTHWA